MSAVEKFPILLSEAEEESSAVPPCFSDEGINVRFHPNSLRDHSTHLSDPHSQGLFCLAENERQRADTWRILS